jgi:hypothetical protein
MEMGSLACFCGTVAWVKGSVAGIHFTEPVELEAARKSRGVPSYSVSAGWLADLKDAYR